MSKWIVLWALTCSCGEDVGRREYQYVTVTCNKGINQQERLADPEKECADARNVWAPDGHVIARPGYWGVGFPVAVTQYAGAGTVDIVEEFPTNTFSQSFNLDTLPTTYHWFIGAAGIPTFATSLGIYANMDTPNTNEMSYLLEYWNGSQWIKLNTTETDSTSLVIHSDHLSSSARFFFPIPADATIQTAASQPSASIGDLLYWFRFTLQSKNGSTQLHPASVSSVGVLQSDSTINYYVPAIFANSTRFLLSYQNSSGVTYIADYPQISGPARAVEAPTAQSFVYLVDEPASYTVVPQFEEAYVSYNYKTTIHKANPNSMADSASLATVETDSNVVGPDADYDPNLIPQLGTWPQAKYIQFHRGEMWAANFKDGANSIRWSAGSPNYKVWPTISIDVLADRDQSPITGLYPFNQNMYVFKADSIWQMVFTGENDDKLNTYRAERIVSGIGCVSNGSIQEIRGNLVFQGHDGVYAFDGTSAKKISDRIQLTFNTIVEGKRAFSSSVNWRTKSLYLLAVATAGSAVNNLVLVWDYKNDAWWIWDNIEAVSFLYVKNAVSEEQIYFVDSNSRLFQLGIGTSDYGTAITGYTITQRIYQTNATRKLRLLEVNSSNLSNSATVEVQPNDAPFTGATSSTLDFSDANELVYGTATYGTSTYTGERERIKGVATNLGGEWFRAKVSHSSKTTPFSMSWLQFGMTVPQGVRK